MRTLAASGLIVLLIAGGAHALPTFDTTRLFKTEAEFTRAIQPYQQAVSANPRNAAAHGWIGFAYLHAYRQHRQGWAPFAAGYLDRAIPPLQEAIKLDATLVQAYVSLHEAYWLKGDYEKAEKVLLEMFQKSRPGWLPPVKFP